MQAAQCRRAWPGGAAPSAGCERPAPQPPRGASEYAAGSIGSSVSCAVATSACEKCEKRAACDRDARLLPERLAWARHGRDRLQQRRAPALLPRRGLARRPPPPWLLRAPPLRGPPRRAPPALWSLAAPRWASRRQSPAAAEAPQERATRQHVKGNGNMKARSARRTGAGAAAAAATCVTPGGMRPSTWLQCMQ
jgi:hypothetical protein